MSIYITGDTHGDLTRIENFIKKMKCTTNDIIVILGDVGINYFGTHNETEAKQKYNNFGPTIFCIHGNHEERPYCFPNYTVKKWNGGIVYYEKEFPNLIFAKDGEIYNLEGKKVIALGGAYSVDKWYRILRTYIAISPILSYQLTENEYKQAILFVQGESKGKNEKAQKALTKAYEAFPKGICSWFHTEQPTDEIKNFVKQQLSENPQIDIVFSHTCPAKYIPTEMFISKINQETVDNSTEYWLDEIENKLSYNAWYCGHWHTNKKIDKMIFLFEDFAKL